MYRESNIIIDGHVHIYPVYSLPFALRSGINNLKSLLCGLTQDVSSQDTYMVWLLAERYDCNLFNELKGENAELKRHGVVVYPSERETLVVESSKKITLFIIAGRQVVTKERLEILSFFNNVPWKDYKYSIHEMIQNVQDSGGMPVINWAPGKWSFSRGRVVEAVINRYAPDKILICDTPLRNTLLPLPRLMQKARGLGVKIIGGSDPLPFAGEERYIGSYGSFIKGIFDPEYPATSLRSLLTDRDIPVQPAGKRNGPFTFLTRQSRIMWRKYLFLLYEKGFKKAGRC